MIQRDLLSRGHELFWDEDIPLGEDWRRVLEERLIGAQCVVVAWSQESVQSKYVLLEAEVARRHSCLVPLLLEKVEIPAPFGLQAADLSNWIGNVRDPNWEKLVAYVETFSTRAPMEKEQDSTLEFPDSGSPPEKKTEPKRPSSSKAAGLQDRLEQEIRSALTLAPVQEDALRDVTTIRVRGDDAFLRELRDLEGHGYAVVERKPGEATLERKKRFNFLLAALLTLVFVFPAILYVLIYPWLPRVQRIYVVQIE